MRNLLFAVVCGFLSAPAFADAPRVLDGTAEMSCAEARSEVDRTGYLPVRQGRVVVRYVCASLRDDAKEIARGTLFIVVAADTNSCTACYNPFQDHSND